MQIADIEIKGISWPVFLGISVVVVAAMYLDALPKGMVGASPWSWCWAFCWNTSATACR